ncbi:MAG: sulfate transporter CysZ [Gammaproteobacteria bacterium]
MLAEFSRGYRYGLSGLAWLARPNIRGLVVVPLLINVAVFSAGMVWLAGALEALQGMLTDWLPDWLDWLSWLLWPLALAAVLVIVWSGFTMVANLIGSPFNGLLAERVQKRHRPDISLRPLPIWRELVRAPLMELRKLGYFILLALPVLVLAVIPGLNVIAPLIWAVYGAWILALEYCEYPLGNDGLGFADARRQLRGRRGLALGFGAGVMTMTLIPGLNLVAMPAAVIGATLMWCDRLHGRAGVL